MPYSAVTAGEKDADSPITVGLLDKLDGNVQGAFEGNAPFKIQAGAMGTDSVGQGAISAGAVHQGELSTSSGTVTHNGDSATSASHTLPGGEYGFYPQFRHTGASNPNDWTVNFLDGSASTSWSSRMRSTHNNEQSWSPDPVLEIRQRYINSSPPIDLGDGPVPLFFFALVGESGEIKQTYAADVPPWLYNGPTSTKPDLVTIEGRKFKNVTAIDPSTKRVTNKMIEVTQGVKNADMELLPHPFYDFAQGDSILILDPPETEELLTLHEAGEEVHNLIRDDYIRIDNTPINRACPDGVSAVSFRWRRSS